jgi:general secretion pathway protein A
LEACRHVRIVTISNPSLTRKEFVQFLARGFKLSAEAARSKTVMLQELEELLVATRARGQSIALVVDEAQALSDELLEEVRLLANIETDEEKLLPLVLAGQPELATRLNERSLRQLKQRVSLRSEIAPLDLSETAAYVASRVRAAGGEPVKLFSREAIRAIHEHSRGIPRTISVICDNALLSGFALGAQPVTQEIVLEVCRDFDFAHGERRRPRAATQRAHEATEAGSSPEESDAAAWTSEKSTAPLEPDTIRAPQRRFSLLGL